MVGLKSQEFFDSTTYSLVADATSRRSPSTPLVTYNGEKYPSTLYELKSGDRPWVLYNSVLWIMDRS